jgi:poly-gamma-glutamate system protein
MYDPAAVSLGGENDDGGGFEDGAASRLLSSIEQAGLLAIHEPDLESNIRSRDSLYFRGGKGAIKAFVSTGGSFSSLGNNSSILDMPPGLVRKAVIPPEKQRGMIQSMLEKGIPVIHLLNIRSLAEKYKFEWDPPVQPEFSSRYHYSAAGFQPLELIVASIFILYFILILAGYRLLQNRK